MEVRWAKCRIERSWLKNCWPHSLGVFLVGEYLAKEGGDGGMYARVRGGVVCSSARLGVHLCTSVFPPWKHHGQAGG